MATDHSTTGAPALLRQTNIDDLMAMLIEVIGELAALKQEVAALRPDGPGSTDPARELDALVHKVLATFGPRPSVPEAEPA